MFSRNLQRINGKIVRQGLRSNINVLSTSRMSLLNSSSSFFHTSAQLNAGQEYHDKFNDPTDHKVYNENAGNNKFQQSLYSNLLSRTPLYALLIITLGVIGMFIIM